MYRSAVPVFFASSVGVCGPAAASALYNPKRSPMRIRAALNVAPKSTMALPRNSFSLSGLMAITSPWNRRSEEHTSELQSHSDLVCRLLLEKKKKREREVRRGKQRYI